MSSGTINGIRRDISRQEVVIDGKAFIEILYEVDFGPKNGTAKVRVLDPCVTEEAQQRRRVAIVKKCETLIQQGRM